MKEFEKEQRLRKEQNIIKIAVSNLSSKSLDYLTGLAEGLKLARRESESKEDWDD